MRLPGVHGHIDRRQFNGRQLTLAGVSVEQFFLELYHSAAELLPEIVDCEVINVDASISRDALGGVQSPEEIQIGTETASTATLEWDPSTALLNQQLTLGSDEKRPLKHIQHSKPIDLWWLYLAWVSLRCPPNTAAACWSTFWNRWQQYWRFSLGLRKPTQHSQCNDCAKHSQYIHCSNASPQEKHQRAQEWQQHLRDQYHDRLIYWHLRWWSRRPASNVLVIIIDGMDKTKGVWPQYSFRVPKMLDKYHRPRTTIHLAMAHGYCYDFYLADDEDFFHGASFFCEVLTQTLARVQSICQSRVQSMPDHLVIQADNTTAQAKNDEVAKFMAVLVRKFKFKTSILQFLRVGHTHEDVDFMFSLLLSRVLRKVRFKVPDELRLAILAGMGPVAASLNCDLNCFLLSHVRDFKGWMAPLGIKLHNCWMTRQGITAPHSFTFKLRMDFPLAEKFNLQTPPPDSVPDELDVFCITKMYMSSKQPSGQPTLVIPSSFMSRIDTHPQGTCYATHPMNEKRRKHLRDLAAALEAFTEDWSAEHSYFRAARELRTLADGRDSQKSEDGYLEAAEPARHMPIELTVSVSVF